MEKKSYVPTKPGEEGRTKLTDIMAVMTSAEKGDMLMERADDKDQMTAASTNQMMKVVPTKTTLFRQPAMRPMPDIKEENKERIFWRR